MRHVVRLSGVIIGYSDLEDVTPSLGRARGRFRPGVGYELVQPVFRLFAEAVPEPGGTVVDAEKLARYHKSRDALPLTLEDATGTVLTGTSIHIVDYAEQQGPAARELEVLIGDEAYWARRNGEARDAARR